VIADASADVRELEDKLGRLARAAHGAALQAVLLATHHNIAWLTGGRSNRVDASREAGTSRLLVTSDGRRLVLANAIEMPRMLDEVLAGLDFEPVEYAWVDDQDPAYAVRTVRDLLGPGAVLGADWPLPDTVGFESVVAQTRALLTDAELDRYRALGKDVGRAVGAVCRELSPGDDERAIAQALGDAVAGLHARGVVLLVGSDERIRKYRHPVPTARAWKHVVLVAVCAERDGLVVSLSRIVTAGAIPPDLQVRTRATAGVFERMLAETRPGTTGAAIFDATKAAYAVAGFPGEELRHHQGGAIGYRAREWVAHPKSAQVVQARQAFAWNPTITGTKIEDTALVIGDRLELITSTPDWPTITINPRSLALEAADVWRMD
jgi:Xaa-Pro aminopeptidase